LLTQPKKIIPGLPTPDPLWHPDPLRLTEILEHARRLGNPMHRVPTLQPLKLMYAHRLCEIGLTEEAWHYVRGISADVKDTRSKFRYRFRVSRNFFFPRVPRSKSTRFFFPRSLALLFYLILI
jgi:hypothetical protein